MLSRYDALSRKWKKCFMTCEKLYDKPVVRRVFLTISLNVYVFVSAKSN